LNKGGEEQIFSEGDIQPGADKKKVGTAVWRRQRYPVKIPRNTDAAIRLYPI